MFGSTVWKTHGTLVASIVAGAVVAIAGVVANQHELARATVLPCADAPILGLAGSDLPGFDAMWPVTTTPAPINPDAGKNLPGLVGVASWQRDLVTGWGRAFIAHAAIDGPYRADLDARARALNYPIQYLPYVPLVGEIVRHAAAPLEVYEEVNVFTDSAAAQAWATNLETTLEQEGGHRVTMPGLPPGSTAVSTVLGSDDGLHETQVQAVLVLGAAAMRATIQGPPLTRDLPEVSRIASTALTRVADACPATP
jgi:hypothetical protein